MKYIILKYHPLQKRTFILSVLLFLFCVGHTQHSMMHEPSTPKKNNFLLMMDSMMMAMNKAPTDPSVETDFIFQMIPHHEGAIKMARYEIQFGKKFEMIQLAKSILTEQSNDIQQMNLWLKNKPSISASASEIYRQQMKGTMSTMMRDMPMDTTPADTDKAFASVMIPHHQAAIDMAKVMIKFTSDQRSKAFATMLISNEQVEIEQMNFFLKK